MFYVLRATCYVLRATCYVLRATFYVLRATCYVLRATFYVLWHMFYVLCINARKMLVANYCEILSVYKRSPKFICYTKMGSVSEEDMQSYFARFNVSNLWQHTYLTYVWAHSDDAEDFMMRSLVNEHKEKKRLTNIQMECDRFWKFNKQFVIKEYDTIKKKTCGEVRDYLQQLIYQRHYLLAFTLSVFFIKKHAGLAEKIIIGILNALSTY